ncbi:Uncharacterized protein Adt_14468 [Abeliophyllum distichum]|uniref:Uncharacterized protein n=1 Tax=Abeliophyllum distichum TaxID=126358 RepID=A0ABD1TZQ5_9LAMI
MAPHLEWYNLIEAFCRVTDKHFENAVRLSSNQLTLSCRVVHNIIAHIIVPRKGLLDEVNHFNLFLLDAFLVRQKVDFPFIMLNHINTIHRAHRVMALPYSMIPTKIFCNFEISFLDEVLLYPKLIDTINIHTLKCMEIVTEDGQWVAKTKEFDTESGPSTLPFEDGEEMDKGDDKEDAPHPSHPHDIPSSHMPSSSTSSFSFTKDHYDLLNGRIDSLTSMVEGLQSLLQQVLAAAQQALNSRFDMVFLLPHPPDN